GIHRNKGSPPTSNRNTTAQPRRAGQTDRGRRAPAGSVEAGDLSGARIAACAWVREGVLATNANVGRGPSLRFIGLFLRSPLGPWSGGGPSLPVSLTRAALRGGGRRLVLGRRLGLARRRTFRHQPHRDGQVAVRGERRPQGPQAESAAGNHP